MFIGDTCLLEKGPQHQRLDINLLDGAVFFFNGSDESAHLLGQPLEGFTVRGRGAELLDGGGALGGPSGFTDVASERDGSAGCAHYLTTPEPSLGRFSNPSESLTPSHVAAGK